MIDAHTDTATPDLRDAERSLVTESNDINTTRQARLRSNCCNFNAMKLKWRPRLFASPKNFDSSLIDLLRPVFAHITTTGLTAACGGIEDSKSRLSSLDRSEHSGTFVVTATVARRVLPPASQTVPVNFLQQQQLQQQPELKVAAPADDTHV